MKQVETVKVWDPLVRLFHWSLVLAFTIDFVTEDDFLLLHVVAGYTIMGLLLVRLVWGFIGPRYARFSDFVYSPATVLAYLKDILTLRGKRYLGHNPAGGAMIVLLLSSLILTTLTGLAVYAAGENAGPLAAWFGHAAKSQAKLLEEVHEFFANFSLLLVVIHIGGVVYESLLHRENLARAMINGRKPLHVKGEEEAP